jgi:exopolyphosphatase/guanosine-5'-triphosphate,3'-diphosphate pyrophosphatase
MIIAAIDIGSNAARLLINEVTDQKEGKPQFTKLNLLRIPLRLGMDVFTKGEIGAEREKMILEAMEVFSKLMKIYKVEHYRACATSAMRDAKNGQEIIEQVAQNTGITIEIITGDQEASLVFENHIAEGLEKDHDYLYIDVGGGSTELTFYEDTKMKYRKSINIGTIRLLNGLVNDAVWQDMKEEIQKNINSKKPIMAIGSGGNINKIFPMSKTKDGKPMSSAFFKKYYREMSGLSVAERMTQFGLREDRADVLVPALQIFNNIMSWSDIDEILVPKISVADGLIHSIYDNLREK